MIIPELVNNKCKPDPAELSTATRFMSNENLRRSWEFIPMHHPYEWNPNKILNPIKNNTLSRISDNVSTKVSSLVFIFIRLLKLNMIVVFIQRNSHLKIQEQEPLNSFKWTE